MPPRTPTRKQPSRKAQPAGTAPLFGLAAVALICTVLAFLWSSHRASPSRTPVATQPSLGTTGFSPKHIYSETANPRVDIAAALAQAKSNHKRVLLDFGGDWCGDCQVLDLFFHQAPNDALLQNNFVLVHVWIGHMDTHLDVAQMYGVPISKGVPALAVLGADGKVLYAQATGEFRDMRHMEPASVTEFLEAWKG